MTGSGNGISNSSRVPSSDTSDFSETSMGFFLQVFYVISFNDTGETFTFSGTDDVDHFVLGEDLVRFNFFFEKGVSELDFISDRSTVDLDFIDVVFFLS